jgi:hypothetical protein
MTTVPFDRETSGIRTANLLLVSLAVLKILIQLAGINHYGFFRDEFYYMACGDHLAFGYVDQPPLIALIAWIVKHTLGDSMFAIRLLPILCGAAIVYLTGRLTRELGGGVFGQFLAAAAILFAPIYLAFDSFFSMNAFEPLIWLVCAWIAIRIVRGASPRLWLLFGTVAGVGLQNKHTMLAFGFALVAGLLLTPERKILASKWLWLGGAIALAIFLPNLIWEATHGWPQVEVVRNGQAFKINHISAAQFLFEQLLFIGPVALPLWLAGLYWYFFDREGAKLRFLGWTYILILGIVMLLDGKTYYVVPIYPALMAAGGVAVEKLLAAPERNWVRLAYAAILLIAGVVTVPFGVPLLPVSTFIRYSNALPYGKSVKTEVDAPVELPQLYADMFGWPNQAKVISNVYYSIPSNERADCAILAGNYGEAGAIDYYGKRYGLPAAISGHNSHYFWGPRNYSGQCMIIFGDNAEEYIKLFGESKLAATISFPHATPGEENLNVYICRKPIAPLSELWPRFKMII